MKYRFDLTEDDFRQALKEYVERKLEMSLGDTRLTIETKSKQNYKSEWENAAFRGYIENAS